MYEGHQPWVYDIGLLWRDTMKDEKRREAHGMFGRGNSHRYFPAGTQPWRRLSR